MTKRLRMVLAVIAGTTMIVALSACGQTRADPCEASMSSSISDTERQELLSECSDQMSKDLGIEGMHCSTDSSQKELRECAQQVGKTLGTL
ncbi:hypothetical protein [Bifidobacterium simiarum]|uniref:Secreted protein n=1 Tax=Bifidobacterium simiarum TaxID=2045441 RepID=A0A2M9HDS1_9BIFI|nr:hypothetical protein [Bifidobacterium simiarum]PJM74951.1 hypothetical protein CSQ87_06875 [Bifidobacterium simiarum]